MYRSKVKHWNSIRYFSISVEYSDLIHRKKITETEEKKWRKKNFPGFFFPSILSFLRKIMFLIYLGIYFDNKYSSCLCWVCVCESGCVMS